MATAADIPGLLAGAPLPVHEATVTRSQTNALGHLRAGLYVQHFETATYAFFALAGLTDTDLRHANTSPFLMDMHVSYMSELRPGEALVVAARCMDQDAKRCRLMLTMEARADGRLCATCELLIVNMDVIVRRPAAWSQTQAAQWQAIVAAHASLAALPQAGRGIGPLNHR